VVTRVDGKRIETTHWSGRVRERSGPARSLARRGSS
jgi:hypothetical protein